MTVVTPTDRPKSVRNSCVIKVFGGVFMLSRCFLDCYVGVWVCVTGLSQISSFFLLLPIVTLLPNFGGFHRTLLFGLFCGCRGFCHRTESDLFLFLLKTVGR